MESQRDTLYVSANKAVKWVYDRVNARANLWISDVNVAYYSASALVNLKATTVTAGSAPPAAVHGFANWQRTVATQGTNTTPVDGTQYVTSLFLPCNKTITGVAFAVGGTGGTDKVYAVLYSAAGAVLKNSSLTGGGATVGTQDTYQTLDFTATYDAIGPGAYFVGISINGGTSRIRTIPAFLQIGLFCGTVAQTHGVSPTVATIAPPSDFTLNTGPMVFVY